MKYEPIDDEILRRIEEIANFPNTVAFHPGIAELRGILARLRGYEAEISRRREMVVAWRRDWLRENDPRDGTDCVTPFDAYFYGAALLPTETPATVAPPTKPSISADAKWCQPSDQQHARKFIVRFCEPDMCDADFDDEDEAREFWSRATVNWNCYLFGTLPIAPALPQSGAGEPVVKALVWREEPVPPCGEWLASTAVGLYCIPLERLEGFGLRFRDREVLGNFHTLDEAKAAAQADYERRIKSALSPSPPQETTR